MSTEWHSVQDRITEETVRTVRDQSMNREPVFRIWYWSGWQLLFQAHLAGIVPLHRQAEGLRILDLGCGTGELTAMLGRLYPNAEVIGVDANELSIERARAGSPPKNVRYERRRFEDFSGTKAFDLVICSEVFEHVEQPDALLATIREALVPGGHLSLSTPSGWMWRRPSLALRLLRRPRFYWRVFLRPERNWTEALPHHPATRPRIVRRMLQAVEFEIITRTSSIWWFKDEEERFAIVYPAMKRWAQRRPLQAGRTFFYVFAMLEALLNLVPPLRIFESRAIFIARKPD